VVNHLQKLKEKEGGRTRFSRLLQAATIAALLRKKKKRLLKLSKEEGSAWMEAKQGAGVSKGG
jgi:hypothetical protein